MSAKIGKRRKVPGPKGKKILERAERSLVKTTVSSSIVFSDKGEGCTLWDVDGNAYLDFGGVGTNNFGFGSKLKPMREAVNRVLKRGVGYYPTTDWQNEWSVRAAEALQARTPINGHALVLGDSGGTNVVEAAIKALRKARPERDFFIRCRGSFHGRTHGALALLDPRKTVRIEHYRLPAYGVIELPFPATHLPGAGKKFVQELEGLRKLPMFTEVSALFLEFVQGEGGVNIADRFAVMYLFEFCRAHDIALVADEIQTGMGRTGTLWAYEQYGICPDIVLAGKSLGGGVQHVSAMVIREDLAFRTLSEHASTFGLEPAKAVAVIVALETLEKKELPQQAKTRGNLLRELLVKCFGASPHVKNIRGLGLMVAVEFHDAKFRDRVWRVCEEHGLIALPCGHDRDNPSLRLMPPLVISEKELKRGVILLEKAVAAVARNP